MTRRISETASGKAIVAIDDTADFEPFPHHVDDSPETVIHPHEHETGLGENARLTDGRKGYLSLNYYNLFWIFVICSVIGLGVETVYHAIVFGGYESRAGLVWGPFSPIYGCGALLLTITLNRVWDRNIIFIFLIAMVIGSGFEWLTSWIMETFFGILAWDYTGTFGSIGGRTNFAFGVMWGILGLTWIRVLLPFVLKLIDLIPWRYHIVITSVMTAFMILNVAFTIEAINRQFERQNDVPATTFIQQAFDQWFPDEWMERRFENMTMDSSKAKRD